MTPRTKKPVEYHGISLPTPLIEEIKKHIKDRKEYRSVADFTKEAIRSKIHQDHFSLSEPKFLKKYEIIKRQEERIKEEKKEKEHELLLNTIIQLQKEIIEIKKTTKKR